MIRLSNGGGLAFVKADEWTNVTRINHFKPSWRIRNPALNGGRRIVARKLALDSAWNYHSFKQAWKQIDVFDQNQLVDWAGIGDHQGHWR